MRNYAAILLFVAGLLLSIKNPSSHTKYPKKYEIGGFSSIVQPDNISCGPTCVLVILQRYGKRPLFNEVKLQTRTTWFSLDDQEIGMTSPDHICAALNNFGVKSHMFYGTTDDLKYFISKDRPVIALVRSSRHTWHYVVVIGYTKEDFVVIEPSSGTKDNICVNNFIGCWNFVTDMEGKDVTAQCPYCFGTGYIGLKNFSPLTICDFCGMTGKSPDYVLWAIKFSDISPRTIIVPDVSLEDNTSNSKDVPLSMETNNTFHAYP